MAKIINLKSQDDITSVVERLWETGEDEVYLASAKASALLKNVIALKLLKREAERLGKEVIIITKDAVSRETAKRAGLASKVSLPKKALEGSEEDEEDGGDKEVFHEVPVQEFESLIEEEVKIRRAGELTHRQFGDIRPKSKSRIVGLRKSDAEDDEAGLLADEEAADKESPDTLEELFAAEKDTVEKETGEEEISLADQQNEFTDDETEGSSAEAEDEEKDWEAEETAGSARRLIVRENKPWFSSWPSFKLRKIKSESGFESGRPAKRKGQAVWSLFSGKFLGIFIGAAAIIALAVLYFILPQVEILITSKSQAINQEFNLAVDKGVKKVEAAQNKIPAQLIKLDKRQAQEFSATGQRQVNEKAKGTLTIYNEYSSSPQALVSTTRFVADNGKIFRLSKTIMVPGAKIDEGKIVASSIDAEVIADQPGADYNVGPGRFTIPGFQGTPKYTAFYGQADAAMSGGASGIMKIVTQDDYNKAKDSLWQKLQPILKGEFKDQLPAELKIIDGAQKEEISGVEVSAAVGLPAEKFTMTLKGTATAVLFNEANIVELIKQKAADKLNTDENLSLSIKQISYQISSVDYSRGQAAIKAKAAGKIIWPVDREALKREIAGQSEDAIRDIFVKHTEIDNVKVIFWPFWVRRAPVNLDKVIIRISD